TGVTLNDGGDSDVGPNGYQNFPVLASVTSSGSGTTITGSLNSTPNTSFTLDFYANDAIDSSTYGEGKTYLGQPPMPVTVTTDINGDVIFTVMVPGVAMGGQFVS